MMRNLLGKLVRTTIITGPAPCPLPAQPQTAPYLLPYTINTIVGGGTTPTVGAACGGQAIATTAADKYGDGCLAGSSSLVMSGSYSLSMNADDKDNVYFVDGTSSSKHIVRRVDAHSGRVTVF